MQRSELTETRTTSRAMVGIERSVAHFRAAPHDTDAVPQDVLLVAEQAQRIDAQLAALLKAANRVLAWSDRQGGRIGIPEDAAGELRAAIAKAEAL